MDAPQSRHQPHPYQALLILALLLSLIIGTLVAWSVLVEAEYERNRQWLEQETQSLARQIETLFQHQTDALERMAARWQLQHNRQSVWNQNAMQLLQDFDSLQVIEWLDTRYEVRWLLPLEGNEAVLGFRYPQDHPNRHSLQQARDSGQALLSNHFELIQGGQGLAYQIPLQRTTGGTVQFDGYLIAVFRVEQLIESLLDQLPLPALSLTLREAGQPIFQRQQEDTLDFLQPVETRLQLGANNTFTLESYQTNALRKTSKIPEIALITGILASLLLCYSLWLVLLNTRRLRALQLSNSALQREITRRQQMEQVLQASQARLQLVLDMTDYSYDALFILALEPFGIVYMNRTCWASIGYTAEQLRNIIAINPDDLIPGARAWLETLQQQVDSGESRIYQKHVRAHSAKLVPLEISVRPTARQGQTYLVCVGRNNYQQLEATAQLERLSQLDGLTGLFNRRYFDTALNAEWRRLQRQQLPLGLLMVDVDHFKLYNDTFGHLAGDDALRQVGQAMQQHAGREGERICRYGGEEFAILLPGADLSQCRKVATLIHNEVRAMRIPHVTEPGQLTISIGIACALPGCPGSPQALVNAADTALYAAKNKGRNQSAIAELIS